MKWLFMCFFATFVANIQQTPLMETLLGCRHSIIGCTDTESFVEVVNEDVTVASILPPIKIASFHCKGDKPIECLLVNFLGDVSTAGCVKIIDGGPQNNHVSLQIFSKPFFPIEYNVRILTKENGTFTCKQS